MKYQAKDLLSKKTKRCYICAFFYNHEQDTLRFVQSPMRVKLTYHPTATSDDNIYILKHKLVKAFDENDREVNLATNKLSAMVSFYSTLDECIEGYDQMRKIVVDKINRDIEKLTNLRDLVDSYNVENKVRGE